MSRDSHHSVLLTDLLRRVSRSFYLTLRVLPQGIREPIGLAYLLARASDTIADTELLPADQRLQILDALDAAIQSETAAMPSMQSLLAHQEDDAEATLLKVCHEAVQLLHQSEASNRSLIREVLQTIISGQKLDLERFHSDTSDKIISLKDEASLDDYTYRVAGCVGAFWTRMCVLHLKGTPSIELQELERLGVRFGQGLQRVNILRDFQKDLSMGRCYLPKEQWKPTGWKPKAHDPQHPGFPELWATHLQKARECLEDGWSYTQSLPSSWLRVRLACAWPILIGVRTLQQLDPPPDAGTSPVKISRPEVYEIMLRTLLSSPFPTLWDTLYQNLQKNPHPKNR